MKCPKCHYLGFETGDRCKNCGYDFSLIPTPSKASVDTDLPLRPLDSAAQGRRAWDGTIERTQEVEMGPSPKVSRFRAEKGLPLFTPGPDDGDEQLIRLTAAPRPPLAVRRTPETPRLRTVTKRTRSSEGDPGLAFSEKNQSEVSQVDEAVADQRPRTSALLASASEPLGVGAWRRMAAVVIDHLLLSAIDVTVVYFTVRMAELPMSGWRELPLVPLLAFLVLVKFSYFFVFTAVGGQTIGKMAARIRVVTAENAPLDAVAAVVRSLAGTLSAASLGLGYVPALLGPQHRAVHDRLTHTRVVALPPA